MHETSLIHAMEQVKEMSRFMEGHLGYSFEQERHLWGGTVRIVFQSEKGSQGIFSTLPCLPEDLGEYGDKEVHAQDAYHLGIIVEGF